MTTLWLALFACNTSLVLEDPEIDGDRDLITDDTGASSADDTGGDNTGGGDDTGGGGDDTGGGGDDTGGGGDDTGGDDTGSSDPVADYTVWIGSRAMTVEGCTQIIYEDGYALSEDWSIELDGAVYDYQDAREACPSCDHFYYITADSDYACGVDITDEFYRGLDLDGGAIYDMNIDWDWYSWDWYVSASTLDDGASFDGWNFEYGYDYEYWWTLYVFEGVVAFPEAR